MNILNELTENYGSIGEEFNEISKKIEVIGQGYLDLHTYAKIQYLQMQIDNIAEYLKEIDSLIEEQVIL